MTDLERIELALHRTQKSFKEDSDIGMFIKQFLHEIQRQNQIVYARETRIKVVE
jgi:hypothetical protein